MDDELRYDPLPDPEELTLYLADLQKEPLGEGSLCPICRRGVMEYDGMLILCCGECGYQGDVGCFT